MLYQTTTPILDPDLAAVKEELLAFLKQRDVQLIGNMAGVVFIGPAHPGANVPTFLSITD